MNLDIQDRKMLYNLIATSQEVDEGVTRMPSELTRNTDNGGYGSKHPSPPAKNVVTCNTILHTISDRIFLDRQAFTPLSTR